MAEKKVSVQEELNKVDNQFKVFDEDVKSMTMDKMNEAPKMEMEPQTKISQNQIANSKDVYLKPKRRLSSQEKFNEKFRAAYEKDSELVYVIAEHRELIGEAIELWTKPYPGTPAEEWIIPTGTPIWMPRYLMEQLKRKYYHRLVMKNTTTSNESLGSFYGTMAAETTVQRLECTEISKNRNISMGRRFH